MKLAHIVMATVWLGTALIPTAIGQSMPQGWRFVLLEDGTAVQCSVVREGPVLTDPKAVNARVMRNNINQIILTAARPDWRLDPNLGPADVKLVIDDAEPIEAEGVPLGPLLMTLVEDAGFEQRLRSADSVKWIVPWGEFHAVVSGLGAAFEMTTVCPE